MTVDNVLLLTGKTEAAYLADALRRDRPDLNVSLAHDHESLAASADALRQARAPYRLISFSTDVIIPADIIDSLPMTGYNFHAGPPEYPGSYPACFAVYDGARAFGVTVHELAEHVDSGAIVAVRRFEASPDDTATDLMGRAYQALAALFFELAPAMIDTDGNLPAVDEHWRLPSRKRSEALELADITPDLPDDEADRRRRAFGHLNR